MGASLRHPHFSSIAPNWEPNFTSSHYRKGMESDCFAPSYFVSWPDISFASSIFPSLHFSIHSFDKIVAIFLDFIVVAP